MPRQAEHASLYRRITRFTGDLFDHWSRDDVPRLSASLAYYAILSSAPLLVMSIALADRVFGQQAVQGQLAWEIQTLVGGDAAQAIQAVIRGAHRPTSGLIATILSIATLLVGASSVVVELHSALNFIWGIADTDAGSWFRNLLDFIKQRLYSTLTVIAAGCLLLISLIASVFITAVGKYFNPLLPTPESVLHLATFRYDGATCWSGHPSHHYCSPSGSNCWLSIWDVWVLNPLMAQPGRWSSFWYGSIILLSFSFWARNSQRCTRATTDLIEVGRLLLRRA
jgi:membrane protein